MKKQSVQYTSHFSIHSVQAMAIYARGMVLVALTAEYHYQECLKAGPFMCISNASLHGGIVTVQQG